MSTLTAPPPPSPPPLPIDDAPAHVPAARPPTRLKPDRRHLWVLLAITALGALLRFAFPDRPPLWGDDAYTVYRTHAEYQPMLDILQDDGFTPLHYQLYWLMARVEPLMPVSAVRFLPAVWGSMLPPAIYFLASFLVRRKTALACALFAACSAYLLGYSRDAKMYMMLWTGTALSTGCLLWWFRTGARVAWLAWVAASLLAASAHMAGVGILALQAIFFLTRRRADWRDAFPFAVGLLIAASGPAGYLTQFSRFVKEEVEDFGFEVEGLGWVVEYNEGRTGPDLLRYATSAYLTSWEWPKPEDDARVAPWLSTSLKAAVFALLLLAAVGALPWSRRLRGLPPREGEAPPEPRGHPARSLSESQTQTARTEPRPPGSPDSGAADSSPERPWRVFLWLGLWLVLPVYFVYCRSVVDFVAPSVWWHEAVEAVAGPGWIRDGAVGAAFYWILSLAIAGVAAAVFCSPRFRRIALWSVPAFALLLLGVAILRTGLPAPDVDRARYLLTPLRWWADTITAPHVLTGLAVVLPGVLVYYAGRTWPSRLSRVARFAAVVAVLYIACWIVYAVNHGKLVKEVGQVLERGGGTLPADVRTALAQQRYGDAYRAMTLPSDPAATAAENAARAQSRATVAAIKQQLIRPGGVWQSIFMPRYFGFVYVAFCIALVALLMRLPTRPLRIAAMSLLIGVNLAQFGGRVFAGTEPPLQHVAREMWETDTVHNRSIAQLCLPPEFLSDPDRADAIKAIRSAATSDPANLLHYAILGGNPNTRVYVNDSPLRGAGHPGFGTLNGQQGKYYLGLERGYYLHPTEWKRITFPLDITRTRRSGGGLGLRAVASDAQQANARRIVVWEKYNAHPPEGPRDPSFNSSTTRQDELGPLLGAGWKLVHSREYPVRFHWTWEDLYIYKRFEYAKE